MDFREILGVRDKRRLKLLEALYYRREGWSASQLIVELNCSLPILMSDVKSINAYDSNYQIIRVNGLFYIFIDKTVNLNSMYSDALMTIPEYQMIEELLYEKYDNITMLSEKLELSPSNAQRYLEKIRKPLAEAGMALYFRPLRIEGVESEVRNFYFRFFTERQSTFENILPNLTLKQYLIIEKYIDDFVEANQMFKKYIFQKKLLYNFYISLWRIKNGHYYPKDELRILGLKLPQSESYERLLEAIRESMGMELTPAHLRDCLWLSFSDAIVFSVTHREYALTDNFKYQDLFMQHYELVQEYDELLGYRLSKQDKINLTTVLCNEFYLCDPKGKFISVLWDNRSVFLNEASKLYIHGIKKVRTLVKAFVKRYRIYQDEGFVRNYVYLLITAKEKSLKWLAKQGPLLKILLLSDLAPTEETFLAQQIQDIVYGNFKINHFEKLSGGTEQLYVEMREYDCLITTRSTKGLSKKYPFVVIDSFLTLEGAHQIQEVISELENRKSKLV